MSKEGETWVIYYTDGEKFTSAQGSPWEAPRRSVQAIASSHPEVGMTWVHGGDYYYWEAEHGGWQKGGSFELWDHLYRAAYPCVIFGRMLSDAAWRDLWRRIQQDYADLEKQGWLSREQDTRRQAEPHQ